MWCRCVVLLTLMTCSCDRRQQAHLDAGGGEGGEQSKLSLLPSTLSLLSSHPSYTITHFWIMAIHNPRVIANIECMPSCAICKCIISEIIWCFKKYFWFCSFIQSWAVFYVLICGWTLLVVPPHRTHLNVAPSLVFQGKMKDNPSFAEYGAWHKAAKVDRWVFVSLKRTEDSTCSCSVLWRRLRYNMTR